MDYERGVVGMVVRAALGERHTRTSENTGNGGEISPHVAWMSESGVYVVSMFIMHTVPLAGY
jgi:hypothetical protein